MRKSIKTIFILFVFAFVVTMSYNANAATNEESASVDESLFDLYTDSDYLYNPSPEENGFKIQDYEDELYNKNYINSTSKDIKFY